MPPRMNITPGQGLLPPPGGMMQPPMGMPPPGGMPPGGMPPGGMPPPGMIPPGGMPPPNFGAFGGRMPMPGMPGMPPMPMPGECLVPVTCVFYADILLAASVGIHIVMNLISYTIVLINIALIHPCAKNICHYSESRCSE